VFVVPFVRVADWPEALDRICAMGFHIVATTPKNDAESLGQFLARGRPPNVAVLVGAEGEGLSAAALSRAQSAVRIPISASVDSLNLSVATGIVLSRLSETPVSDTK
jgi:tRNA G18 (ribose-2'-O)-methylase SpoU